MSRAGFADAGSSVLEKTRTKLVRPPKYTVVMFNDDYTPADFVVELLMDVFRLDEGSAVAVMLAVHNRGSAPCGTYPKDVAETKAREAMDRAAAAGHPLMLDVRPEE